MSQGPIVLAFSGGLDTSYCVPWLRETYGREVVTVTVDTGGLDEASAAVLAERSRALGAVETDQPRLFEVSGLRVSVRHGGEDHRFIGRHALGHLARLREAARLYRDIRLHAALCLAEGLNHEKLCHVHAPLGCGIGLSMTRK